MGNCFGKLDRNEEVLQCLEELLRLMTALGDKKGIADSNWNLGCVYQRLIENEKAIRYLNVSFEISTAVNDQSLIANHNDLSLFKKVRNRN